MFQAFGGFMLEENRANFTKYDLDHDSKLVLVELQSAVRGFFDSEYSGESEAITRDVMRLCDSQHRSKISATEMKEHLPQTKHQELLDFAVEMENRRFNMHDFDQDGCLNLDELRSLSKSFVNDDGNDSDYVNKLAKEILKMCDKPYREGITQYGHATATQMRSYLRHTKHRRFLDFMMRNQQEEFERFDTDKDGQQDHESMREALKAYFLSDMYYADQRKKRAHPLLEHPAWKAPTPGATHNPYNCNADRSILREHQKTYNNSSYDNSAYHNESYKSKPGRPRTAMPKRGTATHARPKSAYNRPAVGAKASQQELAKAVAEASEDLGHAWKEGKYIATRQLAFTVAKICSSKKGSQGSATKVGPPCFKQSALLLTPIQVESAKLVFATWDKNHDEKIDREELAGAIRAVLDKVREVEDNTSGNGIVSAHTCLPPDKIEELINWAFRMADANHDESLDETEFIQIYNSLASNCINYDSLIDDCF